MTAAQPATISRRAKAQREASFAALRAQGMAFVQALCGETWTDHNLHDPGITILEQLCYALTELVYRAEFPVADHLAGPDGRLAFDTLSLHRPQDIFPCRATTAADYRRVMLDAVPGLDDVTFIPPTPTEGANVPGVHRLLLKLSRDAAESDARRITRARAVYRAQRNLGEDLDEHVVLVRDVPCELHAEIEIAGPRDAADVLAEVYDRCAHFIAQSAQFRSLRELRAEGRTLEQIYSGPVVRDGFVCDREGDASSRDTLYVADVAARIRAVDGVKELRQLALQPEGGRETSGSLAWRGGDWALRLRVPGDAGDERPGHVVVRRRGNPVQVTLQALRTKLDDLHAAERASRARLREQSDSDKADSLPQGLHRAFGSYHSVQHQFPAAYGLGRHGVPASAGPQAQARARQMKTYLLLFEQVIAHGAAQLEHLRELFSVNGGSPQSRWWQMLSNDTLPQLEALYVEPAVQIQRGVYEDFDRSPWRKARALDHLLALYGETYSQNSMRQFCAHLAPEDLDHLLLQNKAAYLRDIVELDRDRAAGFDDGQVSWNLPGNCSGLLRRVCLMLGFRSAYSRSLTHSLRHHKLSLARATDVLQRRSGDAAVFVDAAEATSGQAVGLHSEPLTNEHMNADLRVTLASHRPRLDEALFRAAVHHQHYRLWLREGLQGKGKAAWCLALGPDEQGRWWHLADLDSEAAARRAAASLRQFLLRLHHDSEGMHVIEHVLLRPQVRGGGALAALRLPADFFSLRVTVVMPAWTVRTHQSAFRRFAEETVRINCPSHLSVSCQWLDFDAMQRFEERYEAWLQLRCAWCTPPADAAGAVPSAQQLDAAAARVIECLLTSPSEEGDELALQGLA